MTLTAWSTPSCRQKPDRYNQTVRFQSVVLIPVVALWLAAGCNRAPETQEAVRQAVIEAVAQRMNLSSMDVVVQSVNFKGDEAEAVVGFRPKGGSSEQTVAIRYTLEKKSGKWVVKPRANGKNPHGEAGAPGKSMPEGHPPIGETPK